MPRSRKPIKELMNHENVVWKYCSLNREGEIVVVDKKPEDGKNITALLTTSMWFWGKTSTPAKMKSVVENILKRKVDGHEPDIYVAFPCRANERGEADIEYMEKYYGKSQQEFEDKGIEADYVAAYMNDDCRDGAFEGKSDYPGFLTNIPSVPAKEGAEQLSSAILNGFHMIFSLGGGNTMFPKAVLAEEYLSQLEQEGKIDFKKNKSHFGGFSNASIMQFLARGLITPLHTHGVGALLFRDTQARDIIKSGKATDEMSLESAHYIKETTDKMFRLMEDKAAEVTRKMPVSPEMMEVIQNRLQEFGDDIEINNVPLFPYLFGLTFNSLLPKFGDKEKLILNIEGFTPVEKGCGPSDVLFRALECGAIKKEQILCISIEDLARGDQAFYIEKVNGLIPDYNVLPESEKAFVRKKAGTSTEDKECETKVQKYIADSNREASSEYQRMKVVGDMFGIPVIDGGVKRIGHAKIPSLQPKTVALSGIGFDFDAGEISIKSLMGLNEKRKKGLFATNKKSVDCVPPRWDEFESACALARLNPEGSLPDSYQYDREIGTLVEDNIAGEALLREAKIIPLNAAAFSVPSNEFEDVVVGNVLNVTEAEPSSCDNKGIFIHCSRDGGAPGFGYQIFDSNQLDNAKFLIFSIELPKGLDPAFKAQYVENNNDIFRRFFSDVGVDIPIFITTAENELNLTNQDFPGLFKAKINLQEMIQNPAVSLDVLSTDRVESVAHTTQI